MGDASVIAAVADTGPLIHLSEIGALSLLRLFNTMYVPGAVWREATASDRILHSALNTLPNLHHQELSLESVVRFIHTHALTHLHAGEQESLYVCMHSNVNLIVTDDLAVRKAAKSLNLTPVGSLGVIARAFKLQMITRSQAEHHILDLQNVSSLFVTHAIVELALESL